MLTLLATLLAAAATTLPAGGAAAAAVDAGTTAAGIRYEASGSGEPVVLIHAFSLDRRMWEPQIPALATTYRVVRYDLRGHGESAAPDAPYSPVEDLAGVFEALGIQRAALVGLSAGAELAIDFALTHPERVTRLALASPGLSGYRPTTPMDWLTPVFQAAGAGQPERAAALWAETPIMALHTSTGASSRVKELALANSRLWSYKSNPAKPIAPPAIGRLGEIGAPSIVLLGDRDLPHIKEVAGLLAAGIRGAKLVTLAGAGHIANFDVPDAFNAAVTGFLAGR